MIIYSLRNKEPHNLWSGLRTQQKPFHSHPHSSGTSSSSLLAYLCSIFSEIYLLRFPCWSSLSSSFTDSYDSSLTFSSIFSYFLTVNLPYFLNLFLEFGENESRSDRFQTEPSRSSIYGYFLFQDHVNKFLSFLNQ